MRNTDKKKPDMHKRWKTMWVEFYHKIVRWGGGGEKNF